MKQYCHYTSIDTFAKILENKTWRFSRLDQVDDKQEWEHLPFQLAKQIYVSCYTLEEGESIPVWNMYGNNLRGVRINFQNHLHLGTIELPSVSGDGTYKVPRPKMISLMEMLTELGDFKFLQHYDENFNLFRNVEFLQVEYGEIKEIEERKKKAAGYFNGEKGMNGRDMFCLKAKQWGFLNEVRLFIHVIPKADTIFESFDIPCNLKYIDVELDEDKLKYLNVILGPKCSDEDKYRVAKIFHMSGLNPEGRIKHSELRACF